METNVNPRRGIDESRAIIRVVGVELIFTTASIKRPTRAARKRPGRRRRRDVANDSSISISMIYAPAKLRTVVSANAKKYDPPGNHRARPRDISSPPVRYIGPSLSFFSFLSLSLSLSLFPLLHVSRAIHEMRYCEGPGEGRRQCCGHQAGRCIISDIIAFVRGLSGRR